MLKIGNIILGLLTTIILLVSCNNQEKKDKKYFSEFISNIYSVNNLNTQTFTIDNSIDNLITGESGTVIRINRNSFVDKNGNAISGKIEVKLIEALTPIDFVLGNLTTVFDGKPLETGGMIYINATYKNNDIFIANDKSVQIRIPTNSKLSGMSLFEGTKDSNSVKWSNPKIISDTNSVFIFEKTTNVKYNIDGFDFKNEPSHITNLIIEICWEGDGLKIRADSVFKIENYTIRFYKQKKLFGINDSLTNIKGENSFIEDQKTNYIFSIKKLGWANIDRLLDDPRTKEVDLKTIIENEKEFEYVYVTLITQKMYLPGYQKNDNTFGFSHNDEEKQQLPIGETATIIATSYKNNKPFFALKKIIIKEKQTVEIKLIETTKEKLKSELIEKL